MLGKHGERRVQGEREEEGHSEEGWGMERRGEGGACLPVSVMSDEKPFMVIFTVKAAIMQQKNVRQVKLSLQKDEASSIENKSPPTGAPKAAEIPNY